ncbi:MAG TPA: DoxX family protein [Salinimicrobium sp.]|nr:DoxX family protein [Salinimicrobium sp.]
MENIISHLPELLILVFIAVTFLQSGLDKVFDWKGNIGWLKGHFSKTILGGMVPLMVGIILVAEVLTGILAVIGFFLLSFQNEKEIALLSTVMAAITLLMLLLGQRMAKDYAGAFTITGYFIVVIFGVYLLNQ